MNAATDWSNYALFAKLQVCLFELQLLSFFSSKYGFLAFGLYLLDFFYWFLIDFSLSTHQKKTTYNLLFSFYFVSAEATQ